MKALNADESTFRSVAFICICYLTAIPYLFKNKYSKFARNKEHYGFRIISKPY